MQRTRLCRTGLELSIVLATTEFETLLLPHLDLAYGVALKLTRKAPEAESLVQEAALRSLKAFPGFRPGTNFKAWFLRILTNCFFEDCRKSKRAGEQVDVAENLDLYLF